MASRSFVVLLASPEQASETGKWRLGVTVSRRVGNAVVRNRIKRAVRDWFRCNRVRLGGEAGDVVVIARGGAAMLSNAAIASELSETVFRTERAEP